MVVVVVVVVVVMVVGGFVAVFQGGLGLGLRCCLPL